MMVFIFFPQRCSLIMLLYVCVTTKITNDLRWDFSRSNKKAGNCWYPWTMAGESNVRNTRKVVFFSETAVNSQFSLVIYLRVKKPEVLWPSANLRLSPSMQCPSLSSLYNSYSVQSSNSERDSIMPCAVKTSLKPVYRYVFQEIIHLDSLDKKWFSGFKSECTSFWIWKQCMYICKMQLVRRKLSLNQLPLAEI